MTEYVKNLIASVKEKNPSQPEFHQAVEEVLETLSPVVEKHAHYRKSKVLERMVEPERVIQFRVTWVDDNGEIQINRGFRIQMSSIIGPYKGGLRFHPSVNQSILKFLAFEQVFKNSLTTLPMGGGKGGSDFNPKGKSDAEVMRFCQAFMSELFRHIGADTDVPAGDIGVGGREIGFMFGQYRKLTNQFTGVLTGKGSGWGGSLIRPEATGYGNVYFACEMLATKNQNMSGKKCLVSGSGNVAQYTIEKLIELGAKVLSCSDSSGHIYDEAGIDRAKLDYILDLKNNRRGRIEEYASKFKGSTYVANKSVWEYKADCAFPCAIENEIDESAAKKLVANGVSLVSEGANMPTTLPGVKVFLDNKILYAPGKASNAGGVAVSGLEMAQNSQRYAWTREEVDSRLKVIMKNIHASAVKAAEAYGMPGNYVAGANIAGFLKVADSMIDQGIV